MNRIGEQLSPDFDGSTYEPIKDQKRLTGQLNRVYEFMKHGNWWSLAAISHYTGGSQASVSARLRDLRKEKFGSYIIDRRRMGNSGLFQYRLVGK